MILIGIRPPDFAAARAERRRRAAEVDSDETEDLRRDAGPEQTARTERTVEDRKSVV